MALKKYKNLIKWSLYVALAVLLFCFQTAPTKLSVLSDIQFLIPVVIVVASFEKIVPSAVFALFCGLLWDYSVQRQFGYNALILMLVAVAASLVMKLYIMPMPLSVCSLVLIASLVHTILDFFFFFVLTGLSGAFSIFIRQSISAVIATSVFGIAVYFLIYLIYNISPIKAKFDID